MKKNEFVIIKGLSIKELKQKAKIFKKEIADLNMDKNMKKLKDLKSIDKKRKDLAQVLTVLNQKELLAKLEPKAVSSEEKKVSNKKVAKIKTKVGKESTSL